MRFSDALGPHVGFNRDPLFFGGGSESDSSTETNSTTTTNTTTTTTQIDSRAGVADEGVLAQEGSTVTVDRSTTVQEISGEVIADVTDTVDNLVNRNAEVTETFLDESSEIFGQSVGFAENTQARATNLLQDVAQQNSNLATKFLESSKDLVDDRNTSTGEALGNTALIVVGVVVVALVIFNRK